MIGNCTAKMREWGIGAGKWGKILLYCDIQYGILYQAIGVKVHTVLPEGGFLSRISIYVIILLTGVWIILFESFTIPLVISGLFISTGCLYFCSRMLPFPKITNLNIFRLSIYPFFLIGQVYLSAFAVMKIIVTGAAVDTIKIKTSITNPYLRTLLANSITLIPGSISLELQDDTVTVLRLLGKKSAAQDPAKSGDSIKGRIEKMLLKIER